MRAASSQWLRLMRGLRGLVGYILASHAAAGHPVGAAGTLEMPVEALYREFFDETSRAMRSSTTEPDSFLPHLSTAIALPGIKHRLNDSGVPFLSTAGRGRAILVRHHGGVAEEEEEQQLRGPPSAREPRRRRYAGGLHAGRPILETVASGGTGGDACGPPQDARAGR